MVARHAAAVVLTHPADVPHLVRGDLLSQRKRAGGFVLMDAAFTSDAKFVRLTRKVADPIDYAACVGVWWMLLADCRRSKSPLIDWDDYTEYVDQIEKLRAAKLLNEHGFDQESFDRWAPAYRSVSERTPGTKGYAPTPIRTVSTDTSGQFISSQVSNGVGGVGEGERKTFMGFKHKWKPDLAAIERQHEEARQKAAEVTARLQSEKEDPA